MTTGEAQGLYPLLEILVLRKLLSYHLLKVKSSGKNVLDVGCGYGRVCKEIFGPAGFECHGYDYNKENVRVFNKMFGSAERPKPCTYSRYDCYAPLILFDIVFHNWCPEYLVTCELKVFLKKYIICLKKDGLLIIKVSVLDKEAAQKMKKLEMYNSLTHQIHRAEEVYLKIFIELGLTVGYRYRLRVHNSFLDEVVYVISPSQQLQPQPYAQLQKSINQPDLFPKRYQNHLGESLRAPMPQDLEALDRLQKQPCHPFNLVSVLMEDGVRKYLNEG